MDMPKNIMETFDFPEDLQDKIQSGFPLFDDNNLPRDQRMNQTMFGEGKHHLIPSFFQTMVQMKKQRKDFQIAFRSFGHDLETVIYEFNQFCAGKHPCYNGKNGT